MNVLMPSDLDKIKRLIWTILVKLDIPFKEIAYQWIEMAIDENMNLDQAKKAVRLIRSEVALW